MTASLNLDLFENAAEPAGAYQSNQAEIGLPEKTDAVINALVDLVADGKTALVQAFSSGKDSTVSASLMLAALARAAEQGLLSHDIPHFVLSADTGVENPLVADLLTQQHSAMRQFAAKHHIPLHTQIVQPSLSESFVVSIIGGRRAMPRPGITSACSTDWKIRPAQKAMKAHRKQMPDGTRVITLLGSRLDEGQKRSDNLKKHNARSGCEVSEHNGEWLAYPVLDFTTEEIFDYLMLAKEYQPKQIGNPFPTYKHNQGDVIRIYNDAVGECSLFDSAGKKQKGCNARTGCFVCGMAGKEDKSLHNTAKDKAPHLLPLVRFRDYLMAVAEDPACRNYLGTLPGKDDFDSIHAGALGFCGKIGLNLLRYLLTIQAEEEERAYKAGEHPAFAPVTLQHIFALDFQWALRGMQPETWAAMKAWHEVMNCGVRYPIQDHQPSGMKKIPAMSTLELPQDDQKDWDWITTPLMAMHGIEPLVGRGMVVDEEGADLLYGFEYNHLIETTHTRGRVIECLLAYGTVEIPSSKQAQMGERLARVQRLDRVGLLKYAYKGGPLEQMDRDLLSDLI